MHGTSLKNFVAVYLFRYNISFDRYVIGVSNFVKQERSTEKNIFYQMIKYFQVVL